MKNPFSRFYDKQISVYEAEANTYEKQGEKKLIGTLTCDVQPCGTDTESREYGLMENRAYKIFSEESDMFVVGNYILFNEHWYRIVQSEKGQLGQTAVMRGVELED